jgi:adenine-specific DNA-methyltransferase
MARGRQKWTRTSVGDYRHDETKRKNIPPAGIAPTYEGVRQREAKTYAYDPHLDPQLVWAGKAEHTSFEVDVVSLHIHERASTRAILEAVKRPEPQLSLFGNDTLPADKQIEFYQHDVNWANRLILGDSLLVMNSLLVKEGMAGKVQCIYIDPPYGIKYASNFQPRIDRRDVKDKDEDLSREPEQIKAYRDTWKLGIHSYLTYLRDRLLLAKELLTESGSVFVQINDENLHLVRALMDEVFGRENAIAVVPFVKTAGQTARLIATVNDYLLWYARTRELVKYRTIHKRRRFGEEGSTGYVHAMATDGSICHYSPEELEDPASVPKGDRVLNLSPLTSDSGGENSRYPYNLAGKTYRPMRGFWKTTPEGMRRIDDAERLYPSKDILKYIRYWDDFPFFPVHNFWADTQAGGLSGDKLYTVQTNAKVIERCILMTTDPGDLVFDPTSGSGTTAFCAEKWGRRWITCDTSRVALNIARERLMTAKYDYYELRDPQRGPLAGFNYETVPHITLESIAKNPEIDAIAAKWQPEIDEILKGLNKTLGRRLKEWEVPRKPESSEPQKPPRTPRVEAESLKWNKDAKDALERFWTVKRKKRQEIDASIQRNAPQETLYDRPFKKSGVVRVTGPFTVEAIPVPVMSDPSQAPIPQFETSEAQGRIDDRGGDYLSDMIGLLKKQGGVVFPKGKRLELENLRPLNVGMLHAEAEARTNGKKQKVAVSFGPQYGPIAALQVQEAIQSAKVGYDALVLAGFSFESEAQALVQKAKDLVKGLAIHFVNIAPDVLVGDLLKTGRASQIFTAFGQPDIGLTPVKDGTFSVELRGVDIYDPITGEVSSTSGKDVAAWFLDSDYDGMTFHICQAFFPGDDKAWDKLQRALRAQIDEAAFEQMRGTTSFPFKTGKHKRIAVKVIDFRGNEVVRVMALEADGRSERTRASVAEKK